LKEKARMYVRVLLVRLLKNDKALSPVVASIILIAVVIAVSIAATTWMGSISFTFMEVDEFRVTSHSWASDTSYVDLTIQNFGTTLVTISEVKVNAVTASDVSFVSGDETLEAGETAILRVTQSFTPSKKYEFMIITASGTKFAYVAVASSTGTSEIWYNPSWLKRKAVTIDNSLNPNDLTGYQVQLNVDYDSDMIADFSDLRFTDSDCQTLIPYWVESYVASDSAVVWVKVPAIPASSTETIYMYYGNPSATSESNPDDTFDLFLDFTIDGVISYGGSQDSDSAQWEIIDDTSLRMWGNNWKATMKTLTVAGDGSQAICFDFESVGVQAEINGVGLDIDNSISDNWFYRIYGTQNWGLNDHYGYTGAGDWQSYTIVLDNFSGDFNRFVFTNDADAGQATDIYYRNVRVSQYTSQAPSTGFGAEESL
jgi:flagellin-like protein